MANVSYVIEKQIAVLSTSKKGWTKEVNLISWNGAPAKLDIRDWDPEHEKMGKGITLSQDEAVALMNAIEIASGSIAKPSEPAAKPSEPATSQSGFTPEMLAQIEAAKKAMQA